MKPSLDDLQTEAMRDMAADKPDLRFGMKFTS